MRRTIGKRLLESKTQVPHYYLTVEVNMDRVQKLRQMFNKAAGEGKPKLSVNDFSEYQCARGGCRADLCYSRQGFRIGIGRGTRGKLCVVG